MSNKWIENIKVGDQVISQSQFHIGIFSVKRLTPKQIILSNKTRFSKKTGIEHKNSSSRRRIYEATPVGLSDAKYEIDARQARRMLREVKWKNIDNHDVLKIAEIVSKKEQP